MFHLVDDALAGLFQAELAATDVDVDVVVGRAPLGEAPEKPTVFLHLWNVAQPAKSSASGMETIERDGKKVRRARLPTIELAYVVVARAADPRVEHAVLAGALRACLRHTVIPAELVPEELGEGAPTLRVPKVDDPERSGLDAHVFHRHPGIDLRVSVALDIEREEDVAKPPAGADFGFRDRDSGAESSRRFVVGEVAGDDAIGADVLGPGGSAVVDEEGRFSIAASTGDRIAVMTDPPRTAVVPESGRIVID